MATLEEFYCTKFEGNFPQLLLTSPLVRLEQTEQGRLEASRESARIQQTLAAERQHRLQLEQALSEAEEQLKLQQQVTLQEVGHDPTHLQVSLYIWHSHRPSSIQ